MNRNTESHFSVNPISIDAQRSTFDRSSQLKTTFNAGSLIPIFLDEVLPGDTFKMSTSLVCRMTTPIYPVMDNCYLDLYFFYCPSRILWTHWNEFMGENTSTSWEQTTDYEIPQLTAPSTGWNKGTIADYFGVPIGIADLEVNALPFRAYVRIWNDWFRDQNIQDPAYVNTDDTTLTGVNTDTYQTDAQKGGMPLPVNKYHDYFTSCLPEPQKGPDVLLPLGTQAPVYGADGSSVWLYSSSGVGPLTLFNSSAQSPSTFSTVQVKNDGTGTTEHTSSLRFPYKSDDKKMFYADLTEASSATINELRQAFQIQKFYEKDARGGTRYTEIIKSHFGVTSPDQRQQRPEYLGGKRVPINVNQVLQTSSTDETSPQGNTAAYSLTGDSSDSFTKSFTEHGYILGLCCVRTEHTYQQGLSRLFSRKRKFDIYWPEFANLGEQAVLNKEIYATGTDQDDEAFGYQEAWADYRYKPSQVTGAFRSTYATPLDSWHYADKFSSLPVLSDTFMRETTANIDRTLSVQSSVEDQFIADFYFKNICTRPMPMYSIPGIQTM